MGRDNDQAQADLRAAHERLLESQARYQSLFDNLLDGFALCRMLFENGRPVNWTYLEVNPAFERLTGLTDVVGRPVTEVIPGIVEAHPELLETYGRVARGGPPEAFEICVKPLGIWLAITAYHSADDDFVAVFENISEQKRAEESLRDSQTRLQLATEASNIGPWDWNLTTNTVYYSPEWKRQIGYADGEIAGEFREWERRLHPEDRDRILAAVQAYVADPSVGYDVEFRLRHRDGSYRWIHTRGTVIRDAAGTPARMLGCHVDITDQKQAAHEREQLVRTLQLILASTGEGVYGVDAAGRCTFINRAGAEALGWRSEDLVGQDMHALTHHTRADLSPYPRGECPIGQTRTAGTPGRVDGEVFWRRDGTSFPVGYSSYPIVEAGVVRGAVVTFADVTEKIEMETQLRQAQKLEALGRLTGGVAHDFNNLLTAILGYARLLEEALDAADPRREDATEIRNAGERAAHLTQQLLAFSRRQVLQPQVVDLNALVSEVAQMLRRLIGEHIALDTRLGGDLGTTRVDPGQIQQVIMNLVVNARDAMPNGGALVIDTANETLDDEAAVACGVAAGAYVVLGVSDTGAGMNDATLKRIFEPFFTTKPPGKGTGLGLSTVYGIVKQSGGFVRVDSHLGQGSAFRVYLPAANGHAPAQPRPAVADPPAHGTETILLVDDDPAVRGLARRMLERQGYRVIEADGSAAARAAADATTPIDLLLTDVLMPGGGGPDLYQELAAAHPGLKVVFMSGYSDDSAAVHDPMDGHVFLHKPFGGESLVGKVREALDRR
ncbi:MAG: PAS domain S-box protein [Acidobacteria bacterium]|nr:PAS domain S-box protein [Acidobacteriota bacterium]